MPAGQAIGKWTTASRVAGGGHGVRPAHRVPSPRVASCVPGGYGPPPAGRGAPPPPPPFTSYIVSTPPGGFPPPQGFPQGYGAPPQFSESRALGVCPAPRGGGVGGGRGATCLGPLLTSGPDL